VNRVDRLLHLLVAEHDGASITSSLSWSASDSTISTAASVPATTRLSFEVVSAVFDGFRMYWPFW